MATKETKLELMIAGFVCTVIAMLIVSVVVHFKVSILTTMLFLVVVAVGLILPMISDMMKNPDTVLNKSLWKVLISLTD